MPKEHPPHPPASLNLSKHLPHPPWQILWRVGLKIKPCIIHECWWISISDIALTYCCETCVQVQSATKLWQHMAAMGMIPPHNCATSYAISPRPFCCTKTGNRNLLKDMHAVLHQVFGVSVVISIISLICAPSCTYSLYFLGWPYLCSAIVQEGNDEKWSYTASC